MRRNWKKVQPRDLRDAMDLCTEYARDKHNRSVDQIAELMGEVNKWTRFIPTGVGNTTLILNRV